MNSITKRWVRGSLLFIVLILLIAEGLFLYFMISSYYNSVSQELQSRLDSLHTQLSISASGTTALERASNLRSSVEKFEEKAQFELMLVDADGRIVSTSSGILPIYGTIPSDIMGILNPSAENTNQFVGKNENDEKVMAITVRTPYSADGIIAIRLVTSLTRVDGTIFNFVLLSIAFIVIILIVFIFSGVYFIRSIVIPLQKVEATATHIAQGDFDTRIENDSNDEVGRLCKTINHMAEELSHTEKMKNEFISSVSHELRTPLTSIKGWIDTVGRIDPEDPNFHHGIRIISSETDRLYDMVEELLDFSRMQHGLSLQPELLDLVAEIEEAILLETQRALEMGIEILYELPELPVPVLADRNRVRQVMVNVLDNAIKYSFRGGEIRVGIILLEQEVFVLISDKGQGIDADDLEHVKVRFYKGKKSARGSGIGLAVVDEIMKAHGGALEITSEVGVGTEVTLRFPLYSKEKQNGTTL